MTIAVSRLTIAPQSPGESPISPPAYVSARVLAANTAKSITVPLLANYVLLSGNADFYISYTTTAAVPTDLDDGSACELIKTNGGPVWRIMSGGVTALSVISAGVAIVTAAFYGS